MKNDFVNFKFKIGQLKCEDCIYNDNCESMWDRCVANWLHDGGVVHYVACENKGNKGATDEAMEILNSLNK